ncbi:MULTISPECIES: DUF2919 domain-containing protein [Shewanella]|uniref:DUF2919 domain-containing protein n=1 Tax=Shewanella TaxID=22 RepID=UPI001C656FC8|nr:MULTISPECIES: DUF2919 domain-containing protein [Shewanella]QYJ76842.1 DUF2919 domain-containing protein [Shewanella sp. FJAT-52076]QYK06760.1 DUF2919 domain-containing protein [Shewanella zhangzhouensis]
MEHTLLKFEHIRWVDDKGHIKPPLGLYLLLTFLARGWVVFVASLTQFSDRAGLVRLFYPHKESFLLALATGFGALLCYGLIILERKARPDWAMSLFSHLKWLLWPLLVLDAVMLVARLLSSGFLFSWTAAADAVLIFWFAIYLLKSSHLRLYLADWKRPVIHQ